MDNTNEINKEYLAKVIQENSELPIKFLTYWEVVCEDEGYWEGWLEKVSIEYVWENHEVEKCFVGRDDIDEYLYEYFEDQFDADEPSEEDLTFLVIKEWNKLTEEKKIYKSIIVRLGL